MRVLASIEYELLKAFCKREKVVEGQVTDTTSYSKLEVHFGRGWPALIQDRTVLDFGCGVGNEVIQIAKAGARSVCGVDLGDSHLREARKRIEAAGVAGLCRVMKLAPDEKFDCIFSFDSFEHFEKPEEILALMYSLLNPGGRLFVSFGPTWFHPLGGHAFSPFPWAHVLMSESALVRWRNLYFPGQSVTIDQSGLNRMTIRRFFAMCKQGKFEIEKQEVVPIRALRPIHNQLTREWTSSVVRAVLRK
jgi:SAM-dependent methyltransferase